jgi:hypothetical protein
MPPASLLLHPFTHRTLVVFAAGAAVCATALATEAPPSVTTDPQGSTSPSGSPAFLAPFKYVPGNSVKKPEAQAPAPQRTAEQQHLVELNASGDYQGVVREGTVLMAKERPDPELQLIFANSLAWTGHLQAAATAYTDLTKGPYSNEAYIGLANVERWLGRDDLALPHYRMVLERDPANGDANEGQELATRELRPRTAISFGSTSDSSDMRRRSATINHRWRGNDGATIYEVETSGVDDTLPTQQASQQDVTVRVQDVGLALKPSLELSVPSSGDRKLYASARIKFDDDQESLELGSVNWGKLALNANALASQLSASHIGLSAIRTGWIGSLSGRVDYYEISDGNILTSGRLQFNPAWRPLGPHLKPFLSVESRKSSFNTLSYWSPDQGSVSLYAGALAEWGYADWNMFLSAQSGVGLSGDAGNGWSVTAGGKRWISNDVALSMNLWSMSSWRDNANYRSQAATVTMEKLWR